MTSFRSTPSQVPVPDGWRSTPLWRVLRPVARTGHGSEPLLSLSKYRGVYLRDRGEDGVQPSADLSNYLLVKPGDIVVNIMLAWDRALAGSSLHGLVSPAYMVFEVDRNVADPRFLHHLIRSEPARNEWARRSYGIQPSRWRLYWDNFRLVDLPLPPLGTQRIIADFLDTETTRIDALLAKKQRLELLLEERTARFVSRITSGEVGAVAWEPLRLRHAVKDIIDSEHSTAPEVEGGGRLVVRTAAVKSGRLVREGAYETDADSYRRWTRRGRPEQGDVLFTREAPAGEACLVPDEPPVCLGQRMVLFKVDRNRLRGEWLLHSLYSGPAQRFVELLSQGSTVSHLNMSDIRDIPLLLPPLEEQDEWLAQINDQVLKARELRSRLDRQVELLREHRQALITAAVTGRVAVSGVAA